MSKQLSTQDAFYFRKAMPEGVKTGFCVILCGLRNDKNGNRRYEATVVDVDALVWGSLGGPSTGAFRYRFTGHCMSERDEAKWALDHLHLAR